MAIKRALIRLGGTLVFISGSSRAEENGSLIETIAVENVCFSRVVRPQPVQTLRAGLWGFAGVCVLCVQRRVIALGPPGEKGVLGEFREKSLQLPFLGSHKRGC